MCWLVSFGRHQTLGIRIQVGKGNVYHRPVHTLTSTGDLSQVWRSLDRLGGGKEQCDTFLCYLVSWFLCFTLGRFGVVNG